MIARNMRAGRRRPVRRAPRAVQGATWPTDDSAAAGDRREPVAAGRPSRPRPGLRQGAVCPGAGRARAPGWSGSTSRRRCSRPDGDGHRSRAAARPGGCRSGRRASTRAIAVEVFEHLAPQALDDVCGEVRRVLRPGGTFVVVDKNVLLVERPAALAAERGREVDRRAARAAGCIRTADRCASAGSGRPACGGGSGGGSARSGSSTCSRDAEAGRFPFQYVPGDATVRAVGGSGAGRGRVTELLLADAGLAAAALVEDAAGAGADPRPGRRAVRDGQGRPSALVPRRPVRPVRRPGDDARLAARPALTPEHVAIDVDALRRGEPLDPFAALVDHTAARGLVDRRSRTAFRAGGAVSPRRWIRRRLIGRLRRGRHRGRGRLDPAGPVPVSVSLGLQLPGRPR